MRALRLAPIVQALLTNKLFTLKRPASEFAIQINKLDCGHCCVETFVTGLRSGAINGLFEIVCSHYSESDGEVCFKGDTRDAFDDFRCYVLVMRCFTTDHYSETNDCVVFVAHRRPLRSHRQLKRTWNTNDRDCVARSAEPFERINCAADQPADYEVIPAACDYCDSKPFSAQSPLDRLSQSASPLRMASRIFFLVLCSGNGSHREN